MRRSVVAIGNFDGVHTGHQQLLRTAVEHAQELGTEREPLQVIVVTFWPHPMSVVAPGHQPLLLTSLSDRIDLLRRYGADEVRVVQFTRDVAAWSPQKFVDTILGPLNPAVVVVGENFTFGNRAAGTPQMMREFGKGRFDVDIIHLVSIDSERTCSSFVRSALATGDVAAAARHLGRLFRLSGVVVVGDQRGRELGFPTANLWLDGLHLPRFGVYAVIVDVLDGPCRGRYGGCASLGIRPTFGGTRPNLETFLLDFAGDLYGAEISVALIAYQRPELKFDSLEALVAQMQADVVETRAHLATVGQA